MPDPRSYTPSFSFTGYQSTNPDRPLPGPRVDTEFENIHVAIDDTEAALADIRRSDGALQNGIVTVESLDPGMALGILPPANWATATQYAPPQSVWNGNKLYQCLVNHISGVFADDLASGYWNLVVDFDPPIDAAQDAANDAALSATAAQNSANSSAAQAAAALASANASAGSATASANSATAAQGSATAAAGSATNAANSAAAALAQANRAQSISDAMLPDAPSNGTTYGRRNAAWTAITNAIAEAPVDGKAYARKDAAWALGVVDAPNDGQAYVRKGGAWVVANEVPPGSTLYVTATVPPTGYVKKNGALLNRVSFAALWTFAQASGALAASDAAWSGGLQGGFSPGDGSTTFRVPDERGEFTRGLDDGRGVDAGRAINAPEAGALQTHTHVLTMDLIPDHFHVIGSVSATTGGAVVGLLRTSAGTGGASFNTLSAGAATPTGTAANNAGGNAENRVRNIAQLACIKY